MSDPVITSTANSIVKRIRALGQRKQRDVEGAFFVEGIRPVWSAVEAGAPVESLIVAPELLTSTAAHQMVEAQRASGTRVVTVAPHVFEAVAERDHPSGLGAIVRIIPRNLADLTVSRDSFFVGVQDAGNPGNLGTIIRTLDGAGGSGLVLIGHSTDPFSPAAIKASMGTLFSVPFARVAAMQDLVAWCRGHGLAVVTTSPRAPSVYWTVPFQFPLVLLFGSEGEGLNDEEWVRGDVAVRIPMSGSADSLNLAVSAGVLLYEMRRRLES